MIYSGEFPVEQLPEQSVIVFTNGCFDLLHPGHLHLLKLAKAAGDYLIVAVNSDASVTRLKGKDRPHQKMEDRTKALTQVKEVDAIIIFEEDDPLQLLQQVRPQVYVKGADYAEKSFPEADFVRSYGGTVVFVPILEGHSTTTILARGNQKK